MLKLDEFESAFKAADKVPYEHIDITIGSAIVVTDLPTEAARLFGRDAAEFLRAIGTNETTWSTLSADDYQHVGQLLNVVEERRPDLIVAYRNLQGRARDFPFSLGSHVDVLTQATSTPVLLLPTPGPDGRLSEKCSATRNVMVLTDHLTGSNRLIGYGAHFTADDGLLVLAHLEDDAIFKRYLNVIGKIPEIETDEAREHIQHQLLKEPADYIDSCRAALQALNLPIRIEQVVAMGHHVEDCRRLTDEHHVDLLVMNTKDDEQLAMHGLAYPLAVEFRQLPLLLL